MADHEIRKTGEWHVLSFPKSEAWACDGVWLTEERVRELIRDLQAAMDPRCACGDRKASHTGLTLFCAVPRCPCASYTEVTDA